MHRTHCINCSSNRLEEFIDLGKQPNGNKFPDPGQAKNEMLFPIVMLVCKNCWQVQIAEFPPQEFLFDDHPYITGVNVPIVEHFTRLSTHVVDKLKLAKNSLVLDIGCNDGTLLKCFSNKGMRVIGVDPGKRTGELARLNGINVFETFWNSETGDTLKRLKLFPDVITATAVFYHLPDLHDFIEGLKAVMHENSIFIVQCVNLLDLIQRNQFDHFYHEHSCIHAIAPLKRLFAEHQMQIQDVEFTEVHGGSFIAYVTMDTLSGQTNSSVENAIDDEISAGLHTISTYKGFADRVKNNAIILHKLLNDLKSQGKRVYALGAPVKGNTLLNYAKITNDLVECVTEVNQFKIGKLTPGTHIPVIDENQVEKEPDYYLILSWNFLDFFISKYKQFLLRGGKFIVPVPEVKVLGFDSVDNAKYFLYSSEDHEKDQ